MVAEAELRQASGLGACLLPFRNFRTTTQQYTDFSTKFCCTFAWERTASSLVCRNRAISTRLECGAAVAYHVEIVAAGSPERPQAPEREQDHDRGLGW